MSTSTNTFNAGGNTLGITPMAVNPASFQAAPQVVQDRMTYHKAVLESFGVTSLTSLGSLKIRGTVVPQSGLTKPSPTLVSGNTMIQSAYQIDTAKSTPTLRMLSGKAELLQAIPFPKKMTATLAVPSPASALNISVDTAYWAASEIYIEDGTNVILKYPQRYLIIIAEKLTVGQNVTFTWERPYRYVPAKRQKPLTPPDAPMSSTLSGIPGTPGTSGLPGDRGFDGAAAPELELWVLDMAGRPHFDLKGQDGTQGGPGQDGGDGGRGGKGKPAELDWAGFCKAGAGAGGNGGRGGAAGYGGPGGNGGAGGRLNLYAPQTIIENYSKGFAITIEGGSPGAGGIPGNPGAGGPGGAVGDSKNAKFGTACGPGPRTAGQPGAQGSFADAGRVGYAGGILSDPVSFRAIDADEFRRKLLEPSISHVSPLYAFAGDTVTLEGSRYTKTDVVLIDGMETKTQVVSDTMLHFVLPFVTGGSHTLQVRQSDMTLSSKASVFVNPRVISAQQENQVKTRVRPGQKVIVNGSGFSEGTLVLVNNQEMPDVRMVSPTQIEFTLIRPADVESNPAGEQVTLEVRLSDGTPSNEIPLTLETFHMLVMGDSVSWGQGLQEHEKFYSIVGAAVQAREGNIKQYTQVLAHSGAIIGEGKDDIVAPVDGEVPKSFPTILQQCAFFKGEADRVDLILLDGGMNDVDVRTVLNPFHPADLAKLHYDYFYGSMKELLVKVTNKFTQAKVIVTGYYPPVSEKSDMTAVEALLIGVGAIVGGVGGGAAGGILGAAELEKVYKRCAQLEAESKVYLRKAIDERNAELGQQRIFFADPNFGPEHAALTDDPYVFGINLDLTPQDLIAAERLVSCTEAGCTGLDFEICKRASIGHPNQKGAQAYANAILPLL
ncbi:IPT/TIG domain-containing protein [Brevibacillus sp. MER 51]|uniref:IPT/TIG domain-containing protein n=1 Tax=Brevibacillus sp. MER 51 TaxID=2939560 RepID=UPI002040913F|nr:IPT/TIG domain-containing protein [Brevibacillus sp. MER 51]MCM3140877.1 IPT/TIG domain-containing protein [Brevibacillus sp. MER 51]